MWRGDALRFWLPEALESPAPPRPLQEDRMDRMDKIRTIDQLRAMHKSTVHRMREACNPSVPWTRWRRLLDVRNALALRIIGMSRMAA